jgi:AraC-like DNA-binding protein
LSKHRVSVAGPIVLVDFLKEKGFSSRDILTSTGIQLSQLEDIDNYLSCLQFVLLIERAMLLTDNPALGLEFGQRYNFTGGGLLSLGGMAAPTFEESFQFAAQTAEVLNPLLGTSFATKGKMLEINLTEKLPWGNIAHFIVESVYAITAMGAKLISPSPLDQLVFEFNYPPGNSESYYQCFLPGQLKFNAGRNCLSIPLAIAQQKQPTFNPTTARQAKQLLDEKIATLHDEKSLLLEPIKKYIIASKGKTPTIDELASKLHMSPSTLKRRLKAAGTSYGTIVLDVRKNLARELLIHTTDSIDQIAFQLGYHTASNFSAAFKCWYKIPPSLFRTEAQQKEK